MSNHAALCWGIPPPVTEAAAALEAAMDGREVNAVVIVCTAMLADILANTPVPDRQRLRDHIDQGLTLMAAYPLPVGSRFSNQVQ